MYRSLHGFKEEKQNFGAFKLPTLAPDPVIESQGTLNHSISNIPTVTKGKGQKLETRIHDPLSSKQRQSEQSVKISRPEMSAAKPVRRLPIPRLVGGASSPPQLVRRHDFTHHEDDIKYHVEPSRQFKAHSPRQTNDVVIADSKYSDKKRNRDQRRRQTKHSSATSIKLDAVDGTTIGRSKLSPPIGRERESPPTRELNMMERVWDTPWKFCNYKLTDCFIRSTENSGNIKR